MKVKASRRHRGPFLLDTHVWLWHVWGSDRLPASLRRTIDSSSDEVWLSPISIWEFGLLRKRRRVRAEEPFRNWFNDARVRLPVREAPLTAEVAITSDEIDPDLRDPADRLIAATALVHGLTLLTLDDSLTAAEWLPTRSF